MENMHQNENVQDMYIMYIIHKKYDMVGSYKCIEK